MLTASYRHVYFRRGLLLLLFVLVCIFATRWAAGGYNLATFFRRTEVYRAVNMNGSALTIDNIPFAAESGSGPNLTITFGTNGGRFSSGTTLIPATDASRTTMIQSSVWGAGGLSIQFTSVPTGTYQVYFWMWEDNFPATFTLTLNGTTILNSYTSGAAGTWTKSGPWTVAVSGGTITLANTAGATGPDVNISGILIYRIK